MKWLATVLHVDPDADLRAYANSSLLRLGICSIGLDTASELLAAIAMKPVDLLVIDDQLPDVSGATLCSHVRSRSATPILFTTRDNSSDTRVRALELGADDALSKPFEPRELAARIQAIIRRVKPLSSPQHVALGPWTVDLKGRTLVSADGHQRRLTAGEFRLLDEFLRHADQVLSREALAIAVRGVASGPFDRYIDNLVSKLRRKLDGPTPGMELIKTFRNEGYVLNLPR